jgi:hypothetical protein
VLPVEALGLFDIGESRTDHDDVGSAGAAFGEFAEGVPSAADADGEGFVVIGAEIEAPVASGEAASVLSDADEDGAELVDGSGMGFVEESLVEEGEGEREPAFGVWVRVGLDEEAEEGVFQFDDALEPESGVVGDLVSDVGGEERVPFEESGGDHRVERLEDPGGDPGGA